MVSLLSRDDGCKGSKGEVDTRERDQIRLELVKIDIQGTIKTKRGGNRRDNLRDQPVEVGEARRGNSKPLLADIVDSFVINLRKRYEHISCGLEHADAYHERAVRVLEGGVGGKDGVVWLDNGAAHFRCRVHTEFELRLLAIVGGETLKEESTETRTSATTERVEDEEALEARAVVGQTADLVHRRVDELLADGVVTTGI